MSVGKVLAHQAEAAKGTVKQFLGRVTGNRRLRTEGRVDHAKGTAKQSVTKVTDAVKH